MVARLACTDSPRALAVRRRPVPVRDAAHVFAGHARGRGVVRLLIVILVLLLAALQYGLWVGEGSLAEVWRLRQDIEQQRAENDRLRTRNQELEAEVRDLKQGLEAVEERARSELGMAREGETFYQIVEE